MKRLATVSTLTLVLVGCASAVSYSDSHNSNIATPAFSQAMPGSSFIQTIVGMKEQQTMLEEQAAEAAAIKLEQQKIRQQQFDNKVAIEQRIVELRQYANKTWYVFSGSSPRGWDCSGLVVWFYEGLGKELPHSASKQGLLRPKVKDPLPGDVVVFRHNGYRNYHHSGIYIGNNKVIHAGFGKGDKTEIVSLDDSAFKDTDIKFVRILELPVE
jgi:cell wall-associated NlpC family hydrolase